MEMRFLLFILFSVFLAYVFGQTLSNVRLEDHTSYIVELIQKTVNHAQENNWHRLKVQDLSLDIDEEVLNTTVQGTIYFKNGFIVSMQHLDLPSFTVQQVWLYTRSTNTTTLELRSTMRMLDVTLGYDVDGMLNGEKYVNTGTIVYPMIQFQITLIKNLMTEELSSRVVPILARTTNLMKFLPEDEFTPILSHLYDWNSTLPSIISWADDVFAPTVLTVAETEYPIPPFCYDCPVR